MKPGSDQGLAKSQAAPPALPVSPAPGTRLPQPTPGAPKPGPDFPEGQDDPAQAEELERQQDA